MTHTPDFRVGMSGWVYRPWRGVFYPKGLRQSDELAYASARVNSIELNGSFYSLQKPSSWESWRDGTPDGFVFSVKAPRFITHIKRIRDIAEPLRTSSPPGCSPSASSSVRSCGSSHPI